jgi:hypothetical protein
MSDNTTVGGDETLTMKSNRFISKVIVDDILPTEEELFELWRRIDDESSPQQLDDQMVSTSSHRRLPVFAELTNRNKCVVI